MCYAPEEGGISNTIRQKFEAEVSKTAGVVLGRLNVETEQGVRFLFPRVHSGRAFAPERAVRRIWSREGCS